MVLGEVVDDTLDLAKKWKEPVLQAEEGELFIFQPVQQNKNGAQFLLEIEGDVFVLAVLEEGVGRRQAKQGDVGAVDKPQI